MLDDFANNSFVLKILQRGTACNLKKTIKLRTKYGGDRGRRTSFATGIDLVGKQQRNQ
jgi:hypothetical protein